MHEALRYKIVAAAIAARGMARYEERLALRHASELRMRQRLSEKGASGIQIGRILKRARARGLRPKQSGVARMKTVLRSDKMLLPNAVAPVDPEWISEAEAQRWNLWHIRTQQLRTEARATYAAYAFLRGRPFSSVEGMSYSPPPFDRVAEIVAEYSPDDERVALQRLAEWIDAAGWERRDVMQNLGHGKRESAGMFWRHKNPEHESYSHKKDLSDPEGESYKQQHGGQQ